MIALTRMKSKIIKQNRIVALLMCLSLTIGLWAQDSVLVKEVTVSQEYNPTVNDAFKINVSPQTDEPKVFTPSFDYSFFNVPIKKDYELSFIGADEYVPESADELGYQNYVKGGLGNYSTLLGELFYNAYNSENQNVDIFYRNRSSWGDVKLQDGDKVDAPMITNLGKVNFQRRYRYSILTSSLVFDRKGYKYYGYNTLNDTSMYLHSNGDTVALERGKQALTTIGFNIGLEALPRRGSDMLYKADFDFTSASNDDRFSENQFDLLGALEKQLDEMNVGANAVLTLGFYGEGDNDDLAHPYMGETYFALNLSPYVAFIKKNWELKFGAIFDLYQMDNEQEMGVSPLVDFNFNIVPKYFNGFITSGGGIKKNTYAEVMKSNLYVANDIDRKPTKTYLDVEGGFEGHPTKMLSMKLSVGYKMMKDQLFFVNEFVTGDDIGVNLNFNDYTNRFVAEYDDNNVLSFHGEVNYNTYDRWSASAAFDYYNNSLDELPKAWNLPSYKISAYGHYDVTDQIRVKGAFVFLSERYVKISKNNAVDELTPSYDLSLSGEYKYNEHWSFFLDINDMLGSKYYKFNGYSSYRFNALIGATFRF